MKHDVLLIKTSWCKYCPSASAFWREMQKKYDIDYRELDAMTPEGSSVANRLMVMSVPATIIDGRPVMTGVPTEEKVIRYLR